MNETHAVVLHDAGDDDSNAEQGVETGPVEPGCVPAGKGGRNGLLWNVDANVG
jgi:hypothetical protein